MAPTDPDIDEENPSFDDPAKVARQNSGIRAFRSYEEDEGGAVIASPTSESTQNYDREQDLTPNYSEGTGNPSLGGSSSRNYEEQTGIEKAPAAQSNTTSADETPSLRCLNWMNLLAYLANAAVVAVLGYTDFLELPSNDEIAKKYQSLVTPAGYAFGIWGLIFVTQFLWAFSQLLPVYRSSDLVVNGVGCNYVLACIAQIAWTGLFAIEEIPYSMVAMVFILIPLFIALIKLSKIPTQSIFGYFIMKFPFELHAAWIIVASLVNANVVLVALEFEKNYQIIGAAATLLILALVACIFISRQQWVVPIVIVWGCLAIAVELSNPQNVAAVEHFESEIIFTTEFAAGGLASLILITMVVKAFVLGKSDKNVDVDDKEDSDYVKM